MITLLRLLATLCAFMVIGTVGGVELGSISYIDGLLRIALLMVATTQLHSYAEKLERKNRKKRRANRRTSSVSSHKNVV